MLNSGDFLQYTESGKRFLINTGSGKRFFINLNEKYFCWLPEVGHVLGGVEALVAKIESESEESANNKWHISTSALPMCLPQDSREIISLSKILRGFPFTPLGHRNSLLIIENIISSNIYLAAAHIVLTWSFVSVPMPRQVQIQTHQRVFLYLYLYLYVRPTHSTLTIERL